MLRSGKDKRARAAVLGIVVFIIWWGGETWYVFGQGTDQAVFNGFVVGTGIIAALLFRRSNRKQDEILNFSITGRNPRQLPERVSPEVERYLGDRIVILASLVSRAGSEVYLAMHELPPGAESVTRQKQNTLLRQRGLWERLDPTERALASIADGLWSVEQQGEVIVWCERLRLLRWTLGVDAEIIPLAHHPRVDYSLARQVLQEEAALRSVIRASWDLRGERDIAEAYFARIVAELKGRSLVSDNAALDGWAEDLRKQSLGESNDFLVGPKTIEELDEGSLRQLGMVSHTRAWYGGYLVDLIRGDVAMSYAEWSAQEDARKVEH